MQSGNVPLGGRNSNVWLAVAITAVVTAVAVGGGVFAWQQKNMALCKRIMEGGYKTDKEKEQFVNRTRELTAKARVQGSLMFAVGVASKCTQANGHIQRPVNDQLGGGKICSLASIDERWDEMGKNSVTGEQYQYRTVNDTVISAGTGTRDLIECNINTKRCEDSE